MKKALKWILILVPAIMITLAAFVIGSSFLEHRESVAEEKEKYPAAGTLVDVYEDGEYMHVLAEGDGEETLVFLSGFGTPSPVYDFQALTSELHEDFRTVIVERFGYGWSDVTDHDRDIDSVLEETRSALKMAGEEAPFVVVAHSMAGIEAIHWAQTYPDEVTAIVGLEALLPDFYEEKGEPLSPSRMITFLARSGLMRQQPEVFDEQFHAMKKGKLEEEDADIARTLFLRRVQTTNMANEADALSDNVETVQTAPPQVPFFAVIASENEEGKPYMQSYAKQTGGTSEVFQGDHYIHLDHPEAITNKIRSWLREIE